MSKHFSEEQKTIIRQIAQMSGTVTLSHFLESIFEPHKEERDQKDLPSTVQLNFHTPHGKGWIYVSDQKFIDNNHELTEAGARLDTKCFNILSLFPFLTQNGYIQPVERGKPYAEVWGGNDGYRNLILVSNFPEVITKYGRTGWVADPSLKRFISADFRSDDQIQVEEANRRTIWVAILVALMGILGQLLIALLLTQDIRIVTDAN